MALLPWFFVKPSQLGKPVHSHEVVIKDHHGKHAVRPALLTVPFLWLVPGFMDTFCTKAGVKPFGFHAMRHKAAAITFMSQGLNAAQILMGHARATTTDIYVRSAGLYAPQKMILEALGNSGIGQAVGSLLEREIARRLDASGHFVTRAV